MTQLFNQTGFPGKQHPLYLCGHTTRFPIARCHYQVVDLAQQSGHLSPESVLQYDNQANVIVMTLDSDNFHDKVVQLAPVCFNQRLTILQKKCVSKIKPPPSLLFYLHPAQSNRRTGSRGFSDKESPVRLALFHQTLPLLFQRVKTRSCRQTSVAIGNE